MAYAESTVGGSLGGNYRVWVNSIRTYDGSPSENFEEWRVEGGLNKVGGGTASNNYGNSTYNLQLGMNGVGSSGSYNYSFGSGTGRVLAWGTGATRVYRDGAGNGFGFTSRMDINLSNSPYLTSGWVQSSDGVQTKYRHAVLAALSMDVGNIPMTDEGPAWLEFNNPSGAAVDAFIDGPSGRLFTSPSGIGSRYNFVFDTAMITALQQASPNSNTYNINIGVHDNTGGDSYDYRTRTVTIKNDVGQANPTFTNFTYADTNAATVAITGSNQILIQNKSTVRVTVPLANKAVAKKYATMATYGYTIGGYAQSATWSNTADVVKDIGVVSDVSGVQSLATKAVDSRGNTTIVAKNVTIIPYANPVVAPSISASYTNAYNMDSGITINVPSSIIGTISPMTNGSTDLNLVVPASGVKFDLSKGNNTSYSGTPVSVASTRTAGSPNVVITPATLNGLVAGKMNAMGADNTVIWYIKFTITDKLATATYETSIDIGRSIFRIGADEKLYYKEVEFHKEFSQPKTTTNTTLATLTPNIDTFNVYDLTAQSGALALANPTGTKYNGAVLIVRINATTAGAISYGTDLTNVSGLPTPSTTVVGKWLIYGMMWNTAVSKWQIISITTEA